MQSMRVVVAKAVEVVSADAKFEVGVLVRGRSRREKCFKGYRNFLALFCG